MSRLDHSCYRRSTQENVSLPRKIADVVIRSFQDFRPISTLLHKGLPPPEVGDGALSTSAGGCSSAAGRGYNRLGRGRRQVADTQSSSSTTTAADVSLSGSTQVSVADVTSTVASTDAPTTTLSSTLQGTTTLGGGTTLSTQPTSETTAISANSASDTAASGTGLSTTLVSTTTSGADTGILLSTLTTTSTSPSSNTEPQVPVSSTTAIIPAAPTVVPQVSISSTPLPATSVGAAPTVTAFPPLTTSTSPLPTTPAAPPATTAPPATPARTKTRAPPVTKTSVSPPATTTSAAPPATTAPPAPPATTTSPAPPTTTSSPTPPATTTSPTPPATTTSPAPPATTTSVASPATTTPAAPPVTPTSTTPPATTTPAVPPATTTSAVPATTLTSSISTSIVATSFTTDNQPITSATAPLPTTMSESSTATSTLSKVKTSSSSTLSSPMSSIPPSTITATSILATTTLSTVSHHKPSTTSSSSSVAPLTSPPLPESLTSFTSTSSFSTLLPVTISSDPSISTIDPSISTMTVTSVWTSTYSGGQVTTYSTVMETGVLRTDSPKPDGFASNTGGVIAVALSATVFLILLVVLIFFTCRRYQFRQSFGGSSGDLFSAPQLVWHPSFVEVEEEDNPHFTIPAHPHQPPPDGDRYSGGGDNRGGGSAEGSTYNLPQETPSFGGQPYMPGLGQTMQTVVGNGPGLLPHNYSWSAAMSASGLVPGNTLVSATNTPNPVAAQSESSLILRDPFSSQSYDLGSSSPGDAPSTFPTGRRGSLPGSRATPPIGELRRHSSTPPTSFPPEHQSGIERNLSMSDRGNQRGIGFLKNLRRRGKSPAQSIVTARSSPRTNASHESVPSRTASFYGAIQGPSSLLNPGPPPSPPLLRADGDSYQGLPIPPIWSVTLPPSPVPTANSSMVMISGLLRPQIGVLADTQQASSASLRDSEDYTRPLVLDGQRQSTTTLGTHEAAGGSGAVGPDS